MTNEELVNKINQLKRDGVPLLRTNKTSGPYVKLLHERTSFLKGKCPSNVVRLFCLVHGITEHPTCKVPGCNTPVTFFSERNRFKHWCSRECSSTEFAKQYISEQSRDTSLRKYGTNHPSQAHDVKQKYKTTMLERYGVEHPTHSSAICNKIKQTNLERHGVENPMHNPQIAERRNLTNLKRYGVEFPLQNEQIKQKTEQTMLDRYGTPCGLMSGQIRQNIADAVREKYNTYHTNHRNISNESLRRLNNKRWLRYCHHHLKLTLEQISIILGDVSDVTVGNYCKQHGIQTKHFFRSAGERQVSDFLTEFNIPHVCNDRSLIGKELDIYIPQYNLAIEYCGLYWHSEQQGKDRNYHKIKHDLCKQQGIQLLTIFEDEWQQRQHQVKNKILTLCGKRHGQRIFARNCEIVILDAKSKKHFFDINHIQGDGPGSINYGLSYDGQLVACMSFIKHDGGIYYLNRYATSTVVVAGFSKLLTHFKRHNRWEQIVSFADQRWSNGDLYFKTGFQLDTILPPDYYYSGDNGKTRTHKFNYRRKNLPKLLENFDPSLSERVNCDNNGILRIWDCGKMRFIYTNKKTA